MGKKKQPVIDGGATVAAIATADDTEAACTSATAMSISAMYEMCGEPIAVDLVNKKIICGNIFTFDPSTGALAVIEFEKTGVPKYINVITGKSIKHLRKFGDQNNLPDGCLKRTPELESWLGKLLKTAPESNKQTNERRKKLVDWLEANQIRVKSNSDGSISVFDSVRIAPPFTADDCFCNNTIILSRMKKLIEKIPGTNSSAGN